MSVTTSPPLYERIRDLGEANPDYEQLAAVRAILREVLPMIPREAADAILDESEEWLRERAAADLLNNEGPDK
jgi:hypothetical protein